MKAQAAWPARRSLSGQPVLQLQSRNAAEFPGFSLTSRAPTESACPCGCNSSGQTNVARLAREDDCPGRGLEFGQLVAVASGTRFPDFSPHSAFSASSAAIEIKNCRGHREPREFVTKVEAASPLLNYPTMDTAWSNRRAYPIRRAPGIPASKVASFALFALASCSRYPSVNCAGVHT